MRRAFSVGFIVISIVTLAGNLSLQQVLALTPADVNSIENDTGFYDPSDTSCGTVATADGQTALVGSDNEQEAYNFFTSQEGLDAVQASAVVGNFVDESHLDPEILQNGGPDNPNPYAAGQLGWGIAQWTPGYKILGDAQNLNVTGPIYELSTQLQIVWDEMTGISPTGITDLVSSLKQYTTLAQLPAATSYFQTAFEGGVDGSRQKDAQGVYAEYASSTPATSSAATGTTTGDVSAGGCGGSSVAVDCNSQDPATSGLSQTRQSIVCLAEKELTLWSQQPGYPTPAFAADGLLKYTGGTCTGTGTNTTCSGGIYEEWCADFVSWIYYQAGDPFEPPPNWMLAGVGEIQAVGEQNQAFHYHPAGSGYIPQPGDLAIHSGGNYENDGHINIFVSSSGNTMTFIGGDQNQGPYGATPPTRVPPDPPSGSIVSTELVTGYWGDDIVGYVSPD